MIFLRGMRKASRTLWVAWISLALLLAQSASLHIHTASHDHLPEQHDHSHGLSHSHHHASDIHLSIDPAHGDHHSELIPEVEITPDGLVKKFSNPLLMLALFAAVLVLLLPGVCREIFNAHLRRRLILPWRYIVSPPLRAPPLN